MSAPSNMSAPWSPRDKFKAIYNEKRTPSNWKDKYRKRCFDNLKKNRANLLAKFRHTGRSDPESSVQKIMAQEWKMLQYEGTDLPDVLINDEGFKILTSPDDELEKMISLFDEIEKELKEEENALILEYERNEAEEEEVLCSEIKRLCATEVICPVCQKSALKENVNVIFCPCGVRINTESDGLTLRHLASNLHEGLSLHNSGCSHSPAKFHVMNQAGIDNIVMTCDGCEFMYIVI